MVLIETPSGQARIPPHQPSGRSGFLDHGGYWLRGQAEYVQLDHVLCEKFLTGDGSTYSG